MYYFYSPTPAIVKLDGALICRISRNLTAIDRQFTFAEISPLDGKCPIAFEISRPTACKNIALYKTERDIFVRVLYFPEETRPYKKIAHAEKDLHGSRFTATVISDGGIRLIVSTKTNMEILEIPFAPKEVKIEEFYTQKDCFVFVYLIGEKENLLTAFSLNSLELCFEKIVDEYTLGPNLTTKQTFSDCMRHSLSATWEISMPFKGINYSVTRQKNVPVTPETAGILFFEEMRVHGDLKEFLSPEMQERQHMLYDYVGVIDEILPLPYSNDECMIFSGESIKIYKLSFSNGVICNIHEV